MEKLRRPTLCTLEQSMALEGDWEWSDHSGDSGAQNGV